MNDHELEKLNNIRYKYTDKLKKFNLFFMLDSELFLANDKWKRSDDKFKFLSNNAKILLIARRKSNDDYIGIVFQDNEIKYIILIHGWEGGSYTIINIYNSFDKLLEDEKCFN
ncbi:MAG: hypothetical protein JW985_02610 [Alphaproteobacteria bacterium]|nr:hypothetical protein [Alphaproteobacteria bacterium]